MLDKVKEEGVEILASFQVRLETEEVLDWDFDFWDIEDKRWIRRRKECLNVVHGDVYVVCFVIINPDPMKRRRLENGTYTEGGN